MKLLILHTTEDRFPKAEFSNSVIGDKMHPFDNVYCISSARAFPNRLPKRLGISLDDRFLRSHHLRGETSLKLFTNAGVILSIGSRYVVCPEARSLGMPDWIFWESTFTWTVGIYGFPGIGTGERNLIRRNAHHFAVLKMEFMKPLPQGTVKRVVNVGKPRERPQLWTRNSCSRTREQLVQSVGNEKDLCHLQLEGGKSIEKNGMLADAKVEYPKSCIRPTTDNMRSVSLDKKSVERVLWRTPQILG